MRTKPPSDEIRDFLNEKVRLYNRPSFIENDPVCIPHLFTKKQDIEIAGLFAATFAWGRREQIIKSATTLMQLMDMAPHDYVLNAKEHELSRLNTFVHRTFNTEDARYFVRSLRRMYKLNGGLEGTFTRGMQQGNHTVADAIEHFRSFFFYGRYPRRTLKHVSNPAAGSSCKRLNMFLRWMVRKDNNGVDFGLWRKIDPSQLYCPLDVHSGRVARTLGILHRSTDDWKAVEELTHTLLLLDPNDPIKYDFALFGLGVNDEL